MPGYIGLNGLEQTKLIARQQAAQFMGASSGYITSVDANNQMAKVMLQPLGIETGWLPNSYMWGLISFPPEGTEVIVLFEHGNLNAGRIICAFQFPTNPQPVARLGDTVSVYVPGVGTCTGTITSGSAVIKAG
ncbi:MAG: hypothetical protein ACYCVD_04245 [Desulfitobacteriaceae bacterium]